MKLKQLLNEETYDLSALEPLRELLYNKLSKKLVFPILDITKYFKPWIKDKDLIVLLSMSKTNKEQNYVKNFNTSFLMKPSIIFMHLDKHFIREKNWEEEGYREEFLKNYEHEVIHVLDSIKSAKKHIGGTFVEISNKDYKAAVDGGKKGNRSDFGSYILSDSEFNRTINGIKIMSKKYPDELESYNEITSKEDLIDYFISKAVNSESIMHDNDEFKNAGNNVSSLRKDPTFIRKVIERLTREKLMPIYYGKKVPPKKEKKETDEEKIDRINKIMSSYLSPLTKEEKALIKKKPK